MHTAHNLKRFFLFYCATLLSVALLFGVVLNTLWPYLTDMVERWFGVQPTCGCTQFALFPTTPAGQLLFVTLALCGVILLAMITKLVLTSIRTQRYVQQLQANRISKTSYRGVTVNVIQDTKSFAVCIGILQPQVYVSTALAHQLTGFELLAVVQHEAAHARRWDPLQRWLLSVMPSWMPVWSKEIQRYYNAQEIMADEAVMDVASIRSAFVKLVEQLRPSTASLAATWFSTAQARVDHWLGEPVRLPALRFIVISGLVVCGLMVGTYRTFAAEPETKAYGQCVAVQTMCQSVMSYVVQ